MAPRAGLPLSLHVSKRALPAVSEARQTTPGPATARLVVQRWWLRAVAVVVVVTVALEHVGRHGSDEHFALSPRAPPFRVTVLEYLSNDDGDRGRAWREQPLPRWMELHARHLPPSWLVFRLVRASASDDSCRASRVERKRDIPTCRHVLISGLPSTCRFVAQHRRRATIELAGGCGTRPSHRSQYVDMRLNHLGAQLRQHSWMRKKKPSVNLRQFCSVSLPLPTTWVESLCQSLGPGNEAADLL